MTQTHTHTHTEASPPFFLPLSSSLEEIRKTSKSLVLRLRSECFERSHDNRKTAVIVVPDVHISTQRGGIIFSCDFYLIAAKLALWLFFLFSCQPLRFRVVRVSVSRREGRYRTKNIPRSQKNASVVGSCVMRNMRRTGVQFHGVNKVSAPLFSD